ncbi:MAG TPA: outer membrane beta-barrel protein [Burkholderiales bacterium]|nr:outer membrane beta-barrel protein [Burkholderiales bacterium]
MKIQKILVAAALALSATQASAQGGYIGGSIGQSDIDDEITSGLINGSQSVDGKDTAWKIFGGFMFNRHFGLEVGYVDLGEVSYSGTTDAFGPIEPVTDGKVEVWGLNISAIGALPVTEQFSVFGKLGLFFWDAEANDTTGGLPFSAQDDGADLSFGVGLSYNFTRNLGVRAEWEMFQKVSDADASLVSVGLLWRF